MVPTLLLFGLLLGRWWRPTLLIAAVGWPLLLLAQGIIEPGRNLAGAAGIAVVNTGIGILLHQGVRRLVRSRRPSA